MFFKLVLSNLCDMFYEIVINLILEKSLFLFICFYWDFVNFDK